MKRIVSAFAVILTITFSAMSQQFPPASGGGAVVGATLPGTCAVGQFYQVTTVGATFGLNVCTVTNTWILIGPSAGTTAVGSITGFGAGIATWLETPSGTNIASALTSALPNTKGGTGGDSSAQTGVAQVSSGTWSYGNITPTQAGLSNVTNDAQTKASTVPNASGQTPHQVIGTGSGTSFGPVALVAGDIPSLPATGQTFTQAGTGAVTRTVQSKLADSVSAEDFGAVGDGTTNNNAAFAAGIAAVEALANGGTLLIPVGTFKYTVPLVVNTDRVSIVGQGEVATILDYEPTSANTTAIMFGKAINPPANLINQNAVRNISISSSDTTYPKTALMVRDGFAFELSNVAITSWHDTSNLSVGFLTNGRSNYNVHDIYINADSPLVLGKNPNQYYDEDLDHFHFFNLNLVANGNPDITVLSSVSFSNTIFDGYEAWVAGTHGFYFNDVSSVAMASHGLVIDNARWEQSTNTAGYLIYISMSPGVTNLQGVYLKNLYDGRGASSITVHGIYMRGINVCSIEGFVYTGVSVDYLDFDSTDLAFTGSGFYHPSSLITNLTGFAGFNFITGQVSGKNGNLGIGVYEPSTSISVPNTAYYGARNAAGTTDLNLIGANASNQPQVGDGTAPVIVFGTVAALDAFGNWRENGWTSNDGLGGYGTAENLVVQSAAINLTPWNLNAVTVTPDATVDPSGTSLADRVIENSATSPHYAQQVLTLYNSSYVASVFVEANGRNMILQMSDSGSDTPYATFDMTGLTVHGNGNGGIGSILSIGGGWYRCSLLAPTIVAGSVTFRVGLLDGGFNQTYVGNSTSGAYLWGAQVTTGPTLLAYVGTTTADAVASPSSLIGKVSSLGNILNVGTPLIHQIPIWTDATHIKGITGIISDDTGNVTVNSLLTSTLKDANGNPVLVSSATASAVDGVTFTNAATANPATVTIGATGSDTNINLSLAAKGTGVVESSNTLSSTSGFSLPTTGTGVNYVSKWLTYNSGSAFIVRDLTNSVNTISLQAGVAGNSVAFFNGKIAPGASTFAALNTGGPGNGAYVYCSNCDTPLTPGAACTSSGDQAGAAAIRVRSTVVLCF